jgi:CotH kinase protein
LDGFLATPSSRLTNMKHTLTLLSLLYFTLAGAIHAQNGGGKDFFEPTAIQDIQLLFEPKDWARQLDSLRFNGDHLLNAQLIINGKKIGLVGVRIASEYGFSPSSPRNSLYIQLDHVDKSLSHAGYQSIKLSSALRDPSMVREVLGAAIARKYMPAPKANYAQVNVNGQPYGLLVNVEPFEGPFLKRYFQSDDGSLYYCPPPKKENTLRTGCSPSGFGSLQVEKIDACYGDYFKVEQGAGLNGLIEFTKKLNQPNVQLEDILDVDRTLWMLAYNNIFVNLYSYSGGVSRAYYLYKDADGRFTPFIGDYNFIFGTFKNPGTGNGADLNFTALQQMDPALHANNTFKPLINKLLSNELYQKLYYSHLRSILYNELLNGSYETQAKQLQEFIRPALNNDKNKYYPISDIDRSLIATTGKVTQIPGIVELMNERIRFLRKHPALINVPPTIAEVKVKGREKFVATPLSEFSISAKVTDFPQKVKIYYRFSPNEAFKEMAMIDRNNDSVYNAVLKPQNAGAHVEYYIMAEGLRAVSHSPQQYMFERHHSSLEEINK